MIFKVGDLVVYRRKQMKSNLDGYKALVLSSNSVETKIKWIDGPLDDTVEYRLNSNLHVVEFDTGDLEDDI